MWKPSYCWVFVNRFRDHICSGLLPVVKGLMVAFLGPRVSLLLHLLHFGGILIKLSKIQKQVFNLIFVIFGKCFQWDLSRTLRDPTNSLYRSSDRVGLRLYLYKRAGLFDLCNATPPRPLALEGWNWDMLSDMVWRVFMLILVEIGPSIGDIY